jgi:hypothetical protein
MNRYTSSGGPTLTTPLKKIPSVTQTSLLVGKGSMFDPLSRTPSQHPVHGPFDLVGDDETLFLLSDSSHHNLDVIIIQI